MSSTDDRIVKMQFDNAQFKKGALETKQNLADVNKAIDAAGKSKGLLDVSKGMQNVAVTASKMQIATTTALATIVSKATIAGLSLAKSLTFDPIKAGFSEYEALLTKQNTIMNATGFSAKRVKGVLNNLNEYSDKTIYNFANMTDSLMKFVNSGVSLKDAQVSIKGIANASAFAGASAEEANRAMFAFSQSMSLGFVGLQDWNQIESANLGTVKFKEQLLLAAVAAGTLTKKGKGFVTESGKYVTATKGWRDGLKDQWATTEVLNSALGKYADTTTKLGKKAFKSAQDVRTFTAFMGTLKESIASGWSNIFTSLFGNLKQSTKMWTGFSSAIGGVIGKFFDWLSVSLKTWRQMGGFEKTMEGFKNLLAPIGAILDVLGTAFREAFPDSGAGSGKALYGLSAGFAAVTYPLQILADLIRGLTGPMTIFFQIIRVGGEAIGFVLGYIWDFVRAAAGLVDLEAPSTGGLMGWIKELGDVIGDTLDQITKLLNKGKSIPEALGSIDMPSLPGIPKISNPFSGGGGSEAVGDGAQKASASIGGMTIPLEGLMNVLEKVGGFFKSLGDGAKTAGGDVATAAEFMGEVIGKVFTVVKDFLAGISMNDVVESFNMALLTTFIISMSRILLTLSKTFQNVMSLGTGLGAVLESTSGALDSFAATQKAKKIMYYAIAIGLLAVSLWILSKIPFVNLVARLAVLGIMFKLMSVAMKQLGEVVEKMDKKGSAGRMLAFSVAVMALGAAMMLLATALVIFNYVKWDSLAKGLITMGVMMLLMKDMAKVGKGAGPALLGAAVAFLAVGQAMILLAGALMLFNLVKPDAMVKAGAALLAVTVALGVLAGLMKGAWGAAALAAAGAAMIGAATGMNILAVALLLFEKVSWDAMKKAGVALGGLAIGLTLMIAAAPAGIVLPLIGLGLIAVATGLLILGKVDWATVWKLPVFALALAVALLILAPALYLIAPALVLLGVGMLAFGAGLFLATTAITAAMLIFAGGAAVISAFAISAALAFAAFLQTLALQAPVMKQAVLDILQAFIDTIVEAVPMIIQGVKDLWAAVVKEFSGGDDGKGKLKKAGGGATTNFADGIIAKIPGIVRTGARILIAFLKALSSKAESLAEAGVDLVINVLRGIGNKAGELSRAGINLIIKLAEGVSQGLGDLVKAGFKLIGDFLHRLADSIRNDAGQIGSGIKDVVKAMGELGVDMIKGLIGGLDDMAGEALDAMGDLAGSMIKKAKDKFKIWSPSRVFKSIGQFLVMGLTQGIQNNAAAAITAVASMVGGQIAVANEYISGFIQRLDQQSLAARAKAEGLAAAAAKATKASNKTKTKTDDRAAANMTKQAKAADKKADAAEKKAAAAKAAQDRAETWKNADSFERAEIRSADAQRELDAAKKMEARAARNLVEAAALDKASRAEGVTAAQRRAMQAEADRLRAQAKKDAAAANKNLEDAKTAAADALKYQKLAGAEAAAAFQSAFDLDAKEAADAAAFEKLSDMEKAALRRQQAEELQIKALKDLEDAKKLAYTDIEAANDLAGLAQAEADRARQYLEEAARLEGGSGAGGSLGTVVNLDPTEAAALSMSGYSDLYNSATAAAAGARSVEFNQYNTSPESLSPSEIYRQTNNLFAHAVDQLDDATAA